MNDMQQVQDFFKENSYVVIRGVLSPESCKILYQYTKNQTAAVDFKYTYDKENYNEEWDGIFNDSQAPGAYSRYGDPLFDGVLTLLHSAMQGYTGLDLSYNYSYWRLYQKGNVLERHLDRESCEVSTTLCLGYDVSDVDPSVYPDYDWAMWVKNNTTGEETPVHMKPGDMIIYRGCEVEHWRDRFIGKNHAQVFLHYNDNAGNYKFHNDGRPILGIPKSKKFILV